MEDYQEFEKPILEFSVKKFRSSRNRTKTTVLGESMNHYEELSCNYGLRDNPKKTQKSLLDHRLGTRRRYKKSLNRCKECGKGFLYEKCLLNHLQVTHSEKSMRRGLLCSFSVVHRGKRSKRVSRYKKKSLRITVSSSSSFAMFPVSVDDGELLEVAESLILLSMSGGKFLNGSELFGKPLDSNLREFGDGFMRNEQNLVGEPLHSNVEVNLRKDGDFVDGFLSNEQKKLVGEALDEFLSDEQKKPVEISTESDGASKKLSGFLADKKGSEDDESGQQKLVGAGILREETINYQKLVCQETAFEDSISGNKDFQMKDEHRCGLCDKVFSTYQALGGHQTFHRMRNKSKSQTKRCREEESVEAGAEINGSVTLTHKCRVCSRLFRSVQALRSHKKTKTKRPSDSMWRCFYGYWWNI